MNKYDEVIFKGKALSRVYDRIEYYKKMQSSNKSWKISISYLLDILENIHDEIYSLPQLEQLRMANGDEINNIWSIDDVHKVNDDHLAYFERCKTETDWVKLTDEEARHILQKVESGFDAEEGISWSQIDFWVGQYHDGEIPMEEQEDLE